MNDDEILAIANEVLVPAGLTTAEVMRVSPTDDGAKYVVLSIDPPVEPPVSPRTKFYSGTSSFPESPPVDAGKVREIARSMVAHIVKVTSAWPTPWVPANQSEG